MKRPSPSSTSSVDSLYSIPGKVPNPIDMPDYCYFRDRCEMCVEGCTGKYPHEIHLTDTHVVSVLSLCGKRQGG